MLWFVVGSNHVYKFIVVEEKKVSKIENCTMRR